MRVVFFGTSDFAVPSLQAVVAAGHQVPAVVTQPDRPAGRGKHPQLSPVKQAALALGLPVLQPERASAPESIEGLRALGPDLFVVAAFGQILSAGLLAVPRLGAVNVHGSLLPKYRGAAPVQRAIMAGETETGVTIMWMTPELDAGDIILQEATPIGPAETSGEVLDRLAVIGARLLVEALPLIAAGTAPRRPQEAAGVSLAPSLRKEERLIDWRRPAAAIVAQVRALLPRPGAVTCHQGRLLKVLAAEEHFLECAAGAAGQIVEIRGQRMIVRAGSGAVALTRVQPESGRPMSAGDYARGARMERGQTLS